MDEPGIATNLVLKNWKVAKVLISSNLVLTLDWCVSFSSTELMPRQSLQEAFTYFSPSKNLLGKVKEKVEVKVDLDLGSPLFFNQLCYQPYGQ